jgi:hypothetical protein
MKETTHWQLLTDQDSRGQYRHHLIWRIRQLVEF